MACFPPPDLNRSATGASDWSFEAEDVDEGLDVDSDGIELDARGPSAISVVTAAGAGGRVFASLADLRAEQSRLVEEAVDCTGVSPDDASLMLRQHCWDLAAFNEEFFESPDRSRRRAGVLASEDMGTSTSTGQAERRLCGICWTDPGVTVLPCERGVIQNSGERHPSYCRDCWRQYLGHAIADGKGCLDLRCPAPGCAEAVRPSQFQALLGRGDPLERYSRFMAESLVDDSRGRRRWCPGQSCGRAAEEPTKGTEVACPCGLLWCFRCGTDSHRPVGCDIVKKWDEKNRDEGGDASWIKVNTKLCPQCQNPIEKNGGCMHMTCRKPGGCGHEFCWICLKPWASHKACNATPEGDQFENEKAREKHELLRYAHYYERYLAHHKAQLYAAGEQREKMETLAAVVCSDFNMKVSDGAFLSAAVLEIAASRRFLKWTYAAAYFANYSKDHKKLFEFHQAQLEGTLERLSDVMENTRWEGYLDADAKSFRPFYDLRTQIISLTDVVHKFFEALAEAMQTGTLFTG